MNALSINSCTRTTFVLPSSSTNEKMKMYSFALQSFSAPPTAIAGHTHNGMTPSAENVSTALACSALSQRTNEAVGARTCTMTCSAASIVSSTWKLIPPVFVTLESPRRVAIIASLPSGGLPRDAGKKFHRRSVARTFCTHGQSRASTAASRECAMSTLEVDMRVWYVEAVCGAGRAYVASGP